MIKAVVFDLDGTIATFNLDYKKVRVEVRNFLMRRGMPASALSVNESIFEMLKKTDLFMKNSGRIGKNAQTIRDNALAIAENYELEAARNTSLVSGASETLRILREMKLKIGLCTINSEKSTNLILKRFKIRECFDATTSRDKVKYVKPSIDHLRATLEDLEASPRETIFVGDSTVDMKSAGEIGSLAVGLPSGSTSAQELGNSGANYIITQMTDLPPLIASLRQLERENCN